MKDLWKTLSTEPPPPGAWVLVWDSKRKFPAIAKYGKIAWQASGFSISFSHGTQWMAIVPPVEVAVDVEGKKCSVCKHVLPLTSFSKSARKIGGLSYRCKGCDSAYTKSASGRNTKSRSGKWANATAARIEVTQ